MINKYWDPKYDALIEQVHAWNALEGGYYEDLNLRAYKNYKWMDLSEAQMEEEIRRVQADLQKFFYCPICGRKSLLKDAVIKRKILNSSLKLDNAAMPGWMKINASSESCYMRLCPECAAKGKIPDRALGTAYAGNAIVTNNSEIQANTSSGCMGVIAAVISMASLASWLVCLIL